jgi:hypothetical protein
MIKPTPNPPEHEDTSPYESFDSKKLHEAAERALDLHLGTPPDKKSKRRNGDLFIVAPDLHTETVLANASEDLLSISANRRRPGRQCRRLTPLRRTGTQ